MNQQQESYKQLDDFIESQMHSEQAVRELSIVKKAESIFTGVSRDLQEYIADRLDISGARVRGIMKYNDISEFPKGVHHISVCMGTTCIGRGARDILSEIEDELQIKKGERTEDKKFSIDTTGCIKYCAMAPIIMIDGKVHTKVKLEEVRDIIESYRE